MEFPRIGVVVPTYNHAHVLSDAIESILAQTRRPDEIIVVDDGSTDGTQELVSTFDWSIQYVYQDNKGLSAARNTGIRESTADWICFLDADDLWKPRKLDLQLASIRSIGPEIGCVYTRFIVQAPRARSLSPVPPGEGALTLRNLLRRNWIGVLTVAARRDLVLDLGGFDEDLDAVEDWDLWLRMAAANVHFAYVPEPLAIYRLSVGSMHRDAQRMEINGVQMLRKFFERTDLPFGPTDLYRLERLSKASFYVQLAWQAVATGQRNRALSYIWRAIKVWPTVILRSETIGVVVRMPLSRRFYSCLRNWRARISGIEKSVR